MATHRLTIKKTSRSNFYYNPINVALRKRPLNQNIKFQLFRTPLYMLDNLYNKFPELLSGRLLDPCGGDGRYLAFARSKGNKNKHFIVDINKSELPNWHNNGVLKSLGQKNCYVVDFMSFNMKDKGLFDNVCTNPSFKEAKHIVDKCLDSMVNKGHVTVLHRIDWIGTQERSKWIQERGLKYMIVIAKRPVWEIDGRDKNISDTREYAWFVFEKGFKGSSTIKWLT